MVQPSPLHHADTDAASPTETPKRGPHRWVKGESGNIAGRARYTLPDGRTVREAARAATPQALGFLLATLADASAPLQMRIAAAVAVVRCGHADALPQDAQERPKVVVIEKVVPEAFRPVRGVLNSPIREHIWPETVDRVEQQPDGQQVPAPRLIHSTPTPAR
jgi:hypothetical protein